MGRIIQIKNSIITIGNDDGSLTEVRLEDCNFEPNIDDEVNIFRSEEKTMCVKAKEKSSEIQDIIRSGGININLTQNQNSSDIVSSSNYNNTQHVVNKLAYLLLTLFLGGFGIHKFYSRRFLQGILYLIFCWTYIPSIIAFFEFIFTCFKTSDSNGRILV